MEAEVDRALYRLQSLDPTRAVYSPGHQPQDPMEGAAKQPKFVPPESEGGSEGDESSEESSDEAEFEVAAGSSLLGHGSDKSANISDGDKKQRLRQMEESEGAAWARDRASSLGSVDNVEEDQPEGDGDGDGEGGGGGGDATPIP